MGSRVRALGSSPLGKGAGCPTEGAEPEPGAMVAPTFTAEEVSADAGIDLENDVRERTRSDRHLHRDASRHRLSRGLRANEICPRIQSEAESAGGVRLRRGDDVP